MATNPQRRNRTIALAVAATAIVGLLGVIAWTQFRGDGTKAPRSLRVGAREAVTQTLSDLLDLDDQGFRDAFSRDQLAETGEQEGIGQDEIIQAAEDAATEYLDGRVAANEASQDEADEVLDLLLEAVRDHL